jgi:hypothetical protein
MIATQCRNSCVAKLTHRQLVHVRTAAHALGMDNEEDNEEDSEEDKGEVSQSGN